MKINTRIEIVITVIRNSHLLYIVCVMNESSIYLDFKRNAYLNSFSLTFNSAMILQKRCGALSDGDGKKHALPQDFIKQQRAYFAEIDAFELSEEEVGSRSKIYGSWDGNGFSPLLQFLQRDHLCSNTIRL
ncbi:hypothetical protein NC652_031377 [Populus alba x Populus x berolinensis]|nr:hypothetical protein NC652_031377 [Populus alba x Populus x berolinensis]